MNAKPEPNIEPANPSGWDDRFRAILNSSLDAYVTMNAEGSVVDWSSKAELLFGWSAQEVVGRQLADFIVPPAYREAHRQGLKHFLKTGEGPVLGQRLELTALRKGGAEFPIELSVIAVPLTDGLVFNAFVRDISIRTEDARYRTRMAALVDSSYDAIIGKDVVGNIISWNMGACRVYGYTEEEAVGHTIAIILPAGVTEEEPEIRQALQAGQRLEQFETVRQRKDGILIPISVTVSPIAIDEGTIIGWSTIERDITESKRQQEELQRAKEVAEKANHVRAEFLANVSHELRTPMNAIIGMTKIALGEKLTAEVRDYVRTANNAAHSLLTLLNDILDFAKLESGKFTINNEPFALRDTISDTVKTLSARAFEQGLELACEIADDIPDNLIGDATRLRQVLTNLIGNAIKFTEQGEVVVTVKALRNLHGQTKLQFAVRDTGIGISEEDQGRILEPFTQVDASATRRHGGTGLGLAICRELADRMGGRLSVVSELGKGSCFTFRVTFARQNKPKNATPDFTPLDRLKGMPVLIVDDNETNRRIVGETLANWSMKPETAHDGPQALRELRRVRETGAPYPLIIVDALMPGMDGYTLSKQIVEQTPDPPPIILMLSSSDRREFKRREKQGGIAYYLQKPVSQSDLMDAVVGALNVRIESDDENEDPLFRPVSDDSLSVLLAEDTPANQKVVTTILEKRGHDVTVAHNGREAVELSRRNVFDVILMDVQMPIMDGLQATKAIRDQEKRTGQATPIIAMTAHAMRGDREKCLQAGMDAYVAKPIDVGVLIDLIESVTGGTQDELPSSNTETSVAPDSAGVSKDPPVIDLPSVMKRLAGDMDLFHDFIGYFHEDSPKLLGQLRDAVSADDPSGVERAAHRLKGLAANFGANACTTAAHGLEELGRSGQLAEARKHLASLERELERLDEAIREYRR